VIRCGVLDQNPRMAAGVERRSHMEKQERPERDASCVPHRICCGQGSGLSKRPQFGFNAEQVRFPWASLATGSGWLNKESRKAGRRSAESSFPAFLPS
jgi:hypothetical protein